MGNNMTEQTMDTRDPGVASWVGQTLEPNPEHKAIGRWLARLGASIVITGDKDHGATNDKAVIHRWRHYYTQGGQTSDDLRRLPWAGYQGQDHYVHAMGLGVLSGLNGWRCVDFDWFKHEDGTPMDGMVAVKAAADFILALDLPADYPWTVRSGSGKGFQVWFRCTEDLPPDSLPHPAGKDGKATYWGLPKVEGAFDHVELRWSGCQTLVPPSGHPTGPGYQWVNGQPTEAPALVTVAQVLEAFLVVATPKAPKVQTVEAPKRAAFQASGDGIAQKLVAALDVPAFVQKTWAGEVVQDPDGQYRVLGHGGFLVKQGTKRDWVWFHHSGEVGGDALDLLGYSLFGTWSRNDRRDPTKYRAVLELASRETGIDLPAARKYRAILELASRETGIDLPAGRKPQDVAGTKQNPATGAFSSGASGTETRDRTDALDTTTEPLACQAPRLTPDQALDYISRQEVGDAEALAFLYGRTLAWDPTEERWYTWTGDVWVEDQAMKAPTFVYRGLVGAFGQVVKDLAGEYARLTTPGANATKDQLDAVSEQMKTVQGRINKLLTSKRIDTSLKLLKSEVSVPARFWDNHPYLFPVANGVVDLTSGTLIPPTPELHLRTTSLASWTGLDTPAPRWTRFLDEVFQDKAPADRAEVIGYLQRLLGYTMTGDTRDHHFSVWWGEQGRNGKGTILTTVQKVMGRMMGKVSKEVLVHRVRATAGGASQHLYDLKGKRLAYVDELSRDEHLDLGQVKELTGGGTVKARPLYGRGDEWDATHHIILSTNYRPHAATEDEAFWQRASTVDFRMRFLKDPDPADPFQRPQDPDLIDALEAELSGILAWLVQGCLLWQKECRRLKAPDCLKAVTKTYREDEDTLGNFLLDECVLEPGAVIGAKELYTAYRSWAEAMGHKRPWNNVEFGGMLRARPGVEYKRTNAARFYLGIAIRKGPAVAAHPTSPAVAATEQTQGLVARVKAAKTGKAHDGFPEPVPSDQEGLQF